ncbi:MAG: hypothetical protein QM488_08965 [Rhizobiaceae bacterium]
MLSFIKKLSVVGAFAASMMFATSAGAVSISPGDPVVDILAAPEYLHEALVSGDQHFEYKFNSSTLPQPASAVNFHLNTQGDISASTIFWKDTVTNLQIGASTSLIQIVGVGYHAVLNTLFSAAHAAQTLVIDFTTSGGSNIQYSLKVAAVPVPPALLLFGSSILGIGLLSRRRRRKTSLTAA